MSEKRPVSLLLFDILEAVDKIERFTTGITFEKLVQDDRTQDAILRNIQIIGEASKNIPDSIVKAHPEIDWSGVAGIRDIITHRYFRVDWQLLWTSIHEELPGFRKQIAALSREIHEK